jgi:rubrerythrin
VTAITHADVIATGIPEAEIAAPIVTADAPSSPSEDASHEGAYTCTTCGSTWSYQAVRNTGRCPACGCGLSRADFVPD